MIFSIFYISKNTYFEKHLRTTASVNTRAAAYYLQNLLWPVNQSRKLPIRLTYFTNVVEVIVFWVYQKFLKTKVKNI